MIKLHDYQEDAISLLYTKWKTKKRIILWSATGSGKSEMAAYIAQDALRDGFPVVMIVRGRELVKNLSNRLDKYKIDHSVFMANHHRLNKSKLVQICSSDTLSSRGQYPFEDRNCIVIVDEMHKDYEEVYNRYKTQFIVGLSATPFNDNHMYDDYIQTIEPWELRDQGILVPDKIFCPHVIDTSGIKIVAGDFKRDQVAQLVTQGEIVGNVISDYIKYGDNRPSVCFAVNIEHSKQLRDSFVDAGIPAIHCDANSSDEERTEAERKLRDGSVKVLCNVDIFSVGWDCPIVSCIILARPTWSLIWYLQAIGRGLRSSPGKDNCIILDNAGNVYRHGIAYRPRQISLEKPDRKSKTRKGDTTVRTCLECLSIYETPASECPYCGAIPPVREIKTADGILSEYSESEEEILARKIKEAQVQFYKLQWIARSKGLPKIWIKQQIEKKYGARVIPYIDQLIKIGSR